MEHYFVEKDAEKNLRVEIFLGLKKGYKGFTQEKEQVLNFLTEDYKRRLEADEQYIPFIVQDAISTYAYPGDDGIVAEHEPSLVLTSDKNPIYAAHMSNREWANLARDYADGLGAKFEQYRVYVIFTETARAEIFTRKQS